MKRMWGIWLLFSLLVPVSHAAGGGSLDQGMVNPGYHEQPAWFKASFLDIREDIADAASADKRVLLYFYQDGCPYCARMLRENFAQKELVDYTRRHFDVVAINMWGDREVMDLQGRSVTEKRFAEAARVQYTPTLVFLNEEGRVALRVNGYLPPHKFKSALQYVAEKRETQESFPAYLARTAPVAAKGRIAAIPHALAHPLKLADNRRASWRPLLVLFEQRHCSACDELHAQVLSRREMATALTNTDIAQVDIGSSEPVQTPDGRVMPANEWARKLGVLFTPSLVFFDTDGREVFRTEAYLKTYHLHGAVDYVVSGAYRHQPSFQRYLQVRTDELKARGFKVDLME